MEYKKAQCDKSDIYIYIFFTGCSDYEARNGVCCKIICKASFLFFSGTIPQDHATRGHDVQPAAEKEHRPCLH